VRERTTISLNDLRRVDVLKRKRQNAENVKLVDDRRAAPISPKRQLVVEPPLPAKKTMLRNALMVQAQRLRVSVRTPPSTQTRF